MLDTLFIGLAGLVAGGVVNYLSDYLPTKRKLIAPECLSCGKRYDIVSYLFWPRRCASCKSSRSVRTWLVEIIYIGAAIWLWVSPPMRIGFVGGFVLLIYFGLIVVIDFEHRLILNTTSLVGAGLGLGAGIWMHGLRDTLLGGIAGFGAMLFLYLLGALLMGWLARRRGESLEEEALGFGDVNLGGILGLVLGWPGISLGLMMTVLLAGAVSLVYMAFSLITRSYRRDLAIPYGPFLVSSAIALIYFRDLVMAYLGM